MLFSLPAFGDATRTEFLKVDHYDPNPVPGGAPIPVYAPFFDDNPNNTQSSALTPPLGNDNNLIHALGGDDYILSGAGDDQLYGNDGNDTIFGEGGDDRIYGGADDDVLSGDDAAFPTLGGRDYLEGGDGNDVLLGDGGDDVLLGGAGDDLMQGSAGSDVLIMERMAA